MVDDRGRSLKLNGSPRRDTKSRAMLHAEYIIPRSLPRQVQAPRRSTALAFPALARATEEELLELAAADQEADGESHHRGNADCIPRLVTHVTVTRLERFFGLALHLLRTV